MRHKSTECKLSMVLCALPWLPLACFGHDSGHLLNIDEIRKIKLELLCCTVNTKIYLTVTGLWNRGPLKALNSTKLVINENA